MKPDQQNPIPGDEEIDQSDVTSQPSPTDKPSAGDARGDTEKMKQNREHLRVNEDHKTPEMEENHRGTFP